MSCHDKTSKLPLSYKSGLLHCIMKDDGDLQGYILVLWSVLVLHHSIGVKENGELHWCFCAPGVLFCPWGVEFLYYDNCTFLGCICKKSTTITSD